MLPGPSVQPDSGTGRRSRFIYYSRQLSGGSESRVQKRRDTIVAALKELPGVVASDPKGAFYIMVQLPVDDAEKFAIWTLENFAIDNETVMFAPGNGFYSDPELGVNEARLAYVLNCDDLKKAIYILGEALKAYPGKTN